MATSSAHPTPQNGSDAAASKDHNIIDTIARLKPTLKRGSLQVGHFADVVVFDPQAVRDLATFENPMQCSAGIEQVWVNGVLSYTGQGRATGVRAGRFVRRGHKLL